MSSSTPAAVTPAPASTEQIPLPATRELTAQVKQAYEAIEKALPPGETGLRVGMNRFIDRLQLDPTVMIFFLKRLNLITKTGPNNRPVWLVQRGARITQARIQELRDSGQVPKPYVKPAGISAAEHQRLLDRITELEAEVASHRAQKSASPPRLAQA